MIQENISSCTELFAPSESETAKAGSVGVYTPPINRILSFSTLKNIQLYSLILSFDIFGHEMEKKTDRYL